MAADLPPPRRCRRLHLAGLCRCADDAADGADLPAVALQRGAVHAVQCAQQPRQRHRPAQPADRRSRQPALAREARRPESAEGSRAAHPAARPDARRARQAQRRPRGRAPLVGCAQGRARPAHRAADLDAGRARQARRRAMQSAAKDVRDQGGRPAEGDRAPAARAHAARRLARRRQQREGQAVHRPHRGAEARRPSRRPPWCA